jgi:hypothetical protein
LGGKLLKMDAVPVRGFCSHVFRVYYPELSLISFVETIEKYLTFDPYWYS